MRNLLYCLLAVLALTTACKEELPPDEAALKAAKEAVTQGYSHLLAGRYDKFVEYRAGGDSMTADYRDQLATAYKQFMMQQEEDHGGIASFEVSNAEIDSVMQMIQVFLHLKFGDGTQEEILVPVVEDNGEWKMK